jgi:hypothetical protein
MKAIWFALVSLFSAMALAGDVAPEPLSHNCQAKLELTEEVTRLLTKAASHATSSSACIDGPGHHVVVDKVRVCPGRNQRDLITVDATYQITQWAEGDTRMCGRTQIRPRPQLPGEESEAAAKPRLPDLCSGTPGISHHRMQFRFVRKGKGFEIEVPAKIEGFSGPLVDMTPLSKLHEGGCYGKSGPFKPARIRI